LPAITTHQHLALCEPFLVKYYGASKVQGVDRPLGSITTRDRFGLVEVSGKYQIDIRFRMLKPHELAAAMSLHNYKLTGTIADQVKQVGNAVPAQMAEKLCTALLTA
jgi:DNA (cytosine-5)-methyltransferase 1